MPSTMIPCKTKSHSYAKGQQSPWRLVCDNCQLSLSFHRCFVVTTKCLSQSTHNVKRCIDLSLNKFKLILIRNFWGSSPWFDWLPPHNNTPTTNKDIERERDQGPTILSSFGVTPSDPRTPTRVCWLIISPLSKTNLGPCAFGRTSQICGILVSPEWVLILQGTQEREITW